MHKEIKNISIFLIFIFIKRYICLFNPHAITRISSAVTTRVREHISAHFFGKSKDLFHMDFSSLIYSCIVLISSDQLEQFPIISTLKHFYFLSYQLIVKFHHQSTINNEMSSECSSNCLTTHRMFY